MMNNEILLDYVAWFMYTMCILFNYERVVEMARVETSRLGINIPTELLKELDSYASSMNISRTSAVCVLLSQALNSQKAMNDLNELVKMAKAEQKKIAKK